MYKKLIILFSFLTFGLQAMAPAIPAAPTAAERASKRALEQLDTVAGAVTELKEVLDQYRAEGMTIQQARATAARAYEGIGLRGTRERFSRYWWGEGK